MGPSRTAAHFQNAYLNGPFLVHPDPPNRIRKKKYNQRHIRFANVSLSVSFKLKGLLESGHKPGFFTTCPIPQKRSFRILRLAVSTYLGQGLLRRTWSLRHLRSHVKSFPLTCDEDWLQVLNRWIGTEIRSNSLPKVNTKSKVSRYTINDYGTWSNFCLRIRCRIESKIGQFKIYFALGSRWVLLRDQSAHSR